MDRVGKRVYMLLAMITGFCINKTLLGLLLLAFVISGNMISTADGRNSGDNEV
jgi:hypothetical protein